MTFHNGNVASRIFDQVPHTRIDWDNSFGGYYGFLGFALVEKVLGCWGYFHDSIGQVHLAKTPNLINPRP